jgi:hypothetical protein
MGHYWFLAVETPKEKVLIENYYYKLWESWSYPPHMYALIQQAYKLVGEQKVRLTMVGDYTDELVPYYRWLLDMKSSVRQVQVTPPERSEAPIDSAPLPYLVNLTEKEYVNPNVLPTLFTQALLPRELESDYYGGGDWPDLRDLSALWSAHDAKLLTLTRPEGMKDITNELLDARRGVLGEKTVIQELSHLPPKVLVKLAGNYPTLRNLLVKLV